jgi:putative NIF3 family GTP cyclohydrolase 1 type 2
MKTIDIVEQLDTLFQIDAIAPDLPFSRVMPREYAKTGIQLNTYFVPAFLERFHGLLMDGSSEIGQVYLTVFLTEETIDQLIELDVRDALIFTHHPMEFESDGRGFLPLSKRSLDELLGRGISVYVVHTPLDIHPTISTSLSIANSLQLQDIQRFSAWFGSFAGIAGSLTEPMPFQRFLDVVRASLGIQELWFSGYSETVQRIGIIAGGGADVTYMKEARDIGCDTYLSGDIMNRVQTPNSIEKRSEFERERESLHLNLIGASHYATEKSVMIHEMTALFENLGLTTIFLPQANPWK